MNKLKEILFLFKAFFIIFSELLIYTFYNDKITFIDRLTRKLASINILYVKVFQAFALNNSLIDDKINNTLLKFTDNAPWTNDDIDYNILFKLEDDEGLVFQDEGLSYPMNSGMISLVFRAKRSIDNSNVIVKLKRKNIEYKLKEAIDNLLFFMYILSFFPLVQKYQLAEVVNKNIDIIKHQVNFHEEVENLIKIKNNCKNLKYVKIPNVYKEITDKYENVILMEQIIGVPIQNVQEEDYYPFAKQVLKFGVVTTLIHGVAHGDLHGGNILFIKDENDTKHKYKIGVLDFGIIFEMESRMKDVWFGILTEMFTSPPELTARQLLTSGIIEPVDVLKNLPRDHYQNILAFTTEIIQDTIYNSKQANQIQLYKFISKFKTYISDPEISGLGLKPSDSFVKSQLVLAMAHGVTLTLCKDDYITLLDDVINELFHTNMMI
jgi:predicted unusual protein kinase regulating ubiquinone biosynthesis (AarF/ABC1/UbiB family)